MSRGGGEKSKSLCSMGVSEQEESRISNLVQQQNIDVAIKYLSGAVEVMNKALGRNEKVKNNLVDLAISIGSLSKLVSGLMSYHQGKREEVREILSEVASERKHAAGKFEMVEGDNGTLKKKTLTALTFSGEVTREPQSDIEAAINARYKIETYEIVNGVVDKEK